MLRDALLRDAATVVLLRDGAAGLEVCMLRRSPRASFVAGASVFPGGALDDADAASSHVTTGRTDADASRILGVPRGGLAFWVAAVRECFEEAGVLLGASGAGMHAHRDALNDGDVSFVELCVRAGVMIDVGAIYYLAHWITPLGAPRRFDTRFFVGAAPADQAAVHDEREIVDATWLRPADVLAGEHMLILPTEQTLRDLSRFGTAAEVLDAARRAEQHPTRVRRMGGVRIPLPGDEPGLEMGDDLQPEVVRG